MSKQMSSYRAVELAESFGEPAESEEEVIEAWQYLQGGAVMSNKHTPGPWSVRAYQIYADKGTRYGYCLIDCVRGRTQDELEANTALIAAAPELLEALLYVLDCIERDDISDMQPVREAIAKAVVQS
jgi:hypothetical protein